MKKVYFLMYCTCFLLAFTSPAISQSVIYRNTFKAGESVWTNYDDASTNARVSGGKYILTHKQKSYSQIANEVVIDESRDYSIETIVTHISGTDLYLSGLTFAGKDINNLYYFGISANGNYIFAGVKNGAYNSIIGWTASTAINKGNYLPNKLRIEKQGAILKLFINEQQVNQTPMIVPLGNQMGFMVANTQSAAFDYLIASYLKDPAKANKVYEPINAAIQEIAYHTDFASDDQNGWVLKPADSISTSISNGEFIINRSAKRGYTASVTIPETKADKRRDYILETEAIHHSGSQDYGYGLEYGVDSTHEYRFWIAAMGYYSIAHVENNKVKIIVNWTASDAINVGDNVKNKLSIQHKNGQLQFYINDQLTESYPDMDLPGHQFGVSVNANQNVGFKYITFGYLDKTPPPVTAQTTNTPPQVFITAPEATRGLKVVQNSDVLHVAGYTKATSEILSVVVNGIQASVDKTGNFTADVPLAIGDNPLMVTAMDVNMNKGTYRFNIVRNNIAATVQTTVLQSASQGKYYALLIGVQDYKDQSIPSLEGPVSDANSLLASLVNNYTFDKENIISLNNPTKAQFTQAVENLTNKITPDDNLLIFYAGHGLYDETHLQGYWFPSDAVGDKSRRDTWISNGDLVDDIYAIKAKHTLLISDACFSGSIFKTRGLDLAPKDIQELYKKPSRKAMTSGGMSEVPDKSIFMEFLVKRLNENTDKFLPSEQLFASFKSAVVGHSRTKEPQIPQFGEIKEVGDEGGDFIFIKK